MSRDQNEVLGPVVFPDQGGNWWVTAQIRKLRQHKKIKPQDLSGCPIWTTQHCILPDRTSKQRGSLTFEDGLPQGRSQHEDEEDPKENSKLRRFR